MNRLVPSPQDVVLGTPEEAYPHPQYRLARADQRQHALVWGATGTGKSVFLSSLFLQHLARGHGVGLIEPHADLSLLCLSYLSAHGYFERGSAFEDLVYVDFGPEACAPLNVLSQPYEPHTTALMVLDALTRTWPELERAPLFRTLFLSGAVTLIENELPLTALYLLLSDAAFRGRCLARVSDPLVQQVFAQYGDGRRLSGDAASTLRRAFLLSFSPLMRLCLSLPGNLPVRRILDGGAALIVNLGSIPDPVTRRLFGALLMVQIEQAILSRADMPAEDRRHFTLLVDEWPTFAAQGSTIEHILTQARKYGLSLYLAGQYLAQVEAGRLSGATENCGLSVTFRLGRDSAEIQARHIGQVDPHRLKSGWSKHPRYMSGTEQREDWVQTIQNLPPRTALVSLAHRKPVRIRTLTVAHPAGSKAYLAEVIAEYRRRYQVPRVRAEEEWARAFPAYLSNLPTSALSPDKMEELLIDHDHTNDDLQRSLAALFAEAT